MATPTAKRVPDDIEDLLSKHRLHLLINSSPPDFTGRDLSGLDLKPYLLRLARLSRANLRNADLTGVKLGGASLTGADLRHATLDHVVLEAADLHGTDLQETSLRNVDLSKVEGLTAKQLRGADLTGATLPDGIAESLKTLPGVDEATKTSRKVFLTMLAACLYCWLTILSATDAGLLLGNSTLGLPVVQTAIPVVAFFFAAPVLLLIIYLYLHFSLQSLWDALATLPAIFPDGRPVHERALPWILSPLPRMYFTRLKPDCPWMPKFRVRATALLMWWSVPITLVGFWLRVLVLRNTPLTAAHVLMIAGSVWLAGILWRGVTGLLRGIPPVVKPAFRSLAWPPLFWGVSTLALASSFSVGCFLGQPPEGDHALARALAPKLLSLVGLNAFGDLGRANLSAKPEGWNGKDLEAVRVSRSPIVLSAGFLLLRPLASTNDSSKRTSPMRI